MFDKIENADIATKGIRLLPDVPALRDGEMQRKFDELTIDVVVPKFNALCDDVSNMKNQTSFDIDNLKIFKADANVVDALENRVSVIEEEKAEKTEVSDLASIVANKADKATVDDLTTVVNTKADNGVVDALTVVVNSKASQTEVDALTSTVSQKVDTATFNTFKQATKEQIADVYTEMEKKGTAEQFGIVKPDNKTIISQNGVISAVGGGSGEQSDWDEEDITSLAYIKNKPSIPTEETVESWGFSKFDGDYEKLDNKPSIPNEKTVADWGFSKFDGDYDSLTNKPTIPTGDGETIAENEDGTLSVIGSTSVPELTLEEYMAHIDEYRDTLVNITNVSDGGFKVDETLDVNSDNAIANKAVANALNGDRNITTKQAFRANDLTTVEKQVIGVSGNKIWLGNNDIGEVFLQCKGDAFPLSNNYMYLGDFSSSGAGIHDLLHHIFVNSLPHDDSRGTYSQGKFLRNGAWTFTAMTYPDLRYGWLKAKQYHGEEVELIVHEGRFYYTYYHNCNVSQHISTVSTSVCEYSGGDSFVTVHDWRIHEGDTVTNINIWDCVGRGVPTYSAVYAEIVYDGAIVFKVTNCSFISPNNIFRIQFDITRPN